MIINQTNLLRLKTLCYLCCGKTGGRALICDPCWSDLETDSPACDRCGRPVVFGTLCSSCLQKPGSIDATTTLLPYRFPTTKLLRSLKYNGQLLLANEFGRRLAEKALTQCTDLPQLLIPVPLHHSRLFSRGFNQALELGRAISSYTGIPLDYKSCKRIRNTSPQFRLKPKERRKNIKNAFKIYTSIPASSVAIIDDITTTGVTANELAKQLKALGVTKVSLWACAHAG